MMRSLESRLIKLEQPLAARRPYVIRVSSPVTVEEQRQLDEARANGWTIMIGPHVCESVEEWEALYAPSSRQ